MDKRFTWLILGGLVAGILTGLLLNAFLSGPAAIEHASRALGIVSDIFLRLIKMVIGPLVFATLTGGIANLGNGRSLARIAGKSLVWFLAASVISLGIGTVMALLLQPGSHLALPVPEAGTASGVKAAPSVETLIAQAVPTSIVEALATNSILQIVVFSVFAGAALAALGERAALFVKGINQLAAMMFKITDYVMKLAPIGVFAAIAATVTRHGSGVLGSFAALIGSFYLALAILAGLMLVASALVLKGDLRRFLTHLRQPALVAFSTSSSEAAYPRLVEALEAFGASRRITSFVLPLGYSFNLDASMMYCSFGALFIAQAYGIHLDTPQLIALLLMLMLASKGIAAIPRGSLIALAATLPSFNIPEAGLLLLLGVDHFMNMGRSLTNVLGNSLAVVAVARWEGEPFGRPGESAEG